MTPVLDAVRREELRKLASEATPGPWRASETEPPGEQCVHAAGSPQQMFTAWRYTGRLKGEFPYKANAAYIAAMSPDIALALLAYIAELEAGLGPFVAIRDQDLAQTSKLISKSFDGFSLITVHVTKDQFLAAAALLPKASVREERK